MRLPEVAAAPHSGHSARRVVAVVARMGIKVEMVHPAAAAAARKQAAVAEREASVRIVLAAGARLHLVAMARLEALADQVTEAARKAAMVVSGYWDLAVAVVVGEVAKAVAAAHQAEEQAVTEALALQDLQTAEAVAAGATTRRVSAVEAGD